LPRPRAGALDQSPAWLSWIGALPALRWVSGTSDAEREAHTTSLAERFRAGLVPLGLEPQPTDWPSPIVSVQLDHPQLALEMLSAAGIRAAVRRGRLRFGFHVYNSSRDVARALSVLASPAIRPSS
jgi:selenocysteine lyase/cysteine desulfurase